ncbi:hypothetical protein ACTXT7_012308 [Hymenolepis weldensis]
MFVVEDPAMENNVRTETIYKLIIHLNAVYFAHQHGLMPALFLGSISPHVFELLRKKNFTDITRYSKQQKIDELKLS